MSNDIEMSFSGKGFGVLLAFQPAAQMRVTGDDAFSFLQGQFSNELRAPAGSATYGLWLNQKGKVLADSHVLRLRENEFLLLSSSSPAGVIRSRLEQYIIADDVTLLDETENVRGLAFWGENSGKFLGEWLGALPSPGSFLRKGELLVFSGRRTDGENFEIIGPENLRDEAREYFVARGGREIAGEAAELARISAGIPSIPRDIGPADLPNEAGLEATAISFTKGCYLGQEVMARLKNSGQVRRLLRGVRGEGAAPQSGSGLFQGAKKVGEIRSAVSMATEFVALAMFTRLALDEHSGLTFEPTAEPVKKGPVWMT